MLVVHRQHHGKFQDASLRVIVAKAGTSPCSIYTRFHDKEGLFHALVDEVVEYFLSWFLSEQAGFDDRTVEAKADVLDYASGKFELMVDYLYDHYDVFRLLVRCADIDCYERMLDRMIEIDNEYTVRYMTSTDHDVHRFRPHDAGTDAHAGQCLLFRPGRNQPP